MAVTDQVDEGRIGKEFLDEVELQCVGRVLLGPAGLARTGQHLGLELAVQGPDALEPPLAAQAIGRHKVPVAPDDGLQVAQEVGFLTARDGRMRNQG